MRYRLAALLLAVALLFTITGCSDVVGEIAGNVADAAVKELEKQVKATLEEYKVEVVEIKSAVGKLSNVSDSELQFFCGVLVRSNSDALPQGGAAALGKIFDQAGIQPQSSSKIESELLQNKGISFKHTDFSGGNYYLIWAYTASFKENLTEMLSELELPSMPDSWKTFESTEVSGVG